MADYPTNYPSFTDLDGQATLAANNHAARHNKVHAEVLALSQRVGKTGDTVQTTHAYKLSSITGANKAETQENKAPAIDTSTVSFPTNKAVKDYVDAAIAASKSSMYPVGSLYYNATNATNPATLLGFGTWSAYAQGRVPVGLDSSQTEFDTIGETGGDKNLQAHTHTRGTMNITSGTPGIRNGWTDSSGGGTMMYSQSSGAFYTDRPSGDGYWWANPTSSGGAGVNTQYHTRLNFDASRNWTGETSTAGTGAAQNLQPYIVVYIWIRTAQTLVNYNYIRLNKNNETIHPKPSN